MKIKEVAKTKTLRDFYLNHRWLLLVAIVFIIWKFFLIGILWHNRSLPPEPDDSLIYTGHIYSVLRCSALPCNTPYLSLQSSNGFLYLSYRIFWGTVAKVISISQTQVFQASFYMGTIFLAATLVLWLIKFVPSPKARIFALLFLGLFHGGGAYHGFFWVVPSFFALLLLFLLLSIIHTPGKYWPMIITSLLVIALVFTHPLGVYFLAILLIYILTLQLLGQKISRSEWKKTILAVMLGIVAVFSTNQYLTHIERGNSPVISLIEYAKKPDPVTAPPVTPTYKHIYHDYITWIIPAWPAVLILIYVLWINYSYKNYRLLALYLASAIGTAIASLHPFGIRSLILLWPITYGLYGTATWYTYDLLKKNIQLNITRILATSSIIIFIILFAIANGAYSILFNLYMNQRDNYNFPNSLQIDISSILQTGDTISFNNGVLNSYFFYNTELFNKVDLNPNIKTKYLIELEGGSNANNSPLFRYFAYGSRILRGNNVEPPKSKSLEETKSTPPDYRQLWQNGDVVVYQKND